MIAHAIARMSALSEVAMVGSATTKLRPAKPVMNCPSMAITLSHGGPTIYRSPSRSAQVLVGTIRGVACMERDAGGSGWHVAHRSLTDSHIHALLIELESGTVFAGVNHGGVFASDDGGRTWQRRD